MEQDSLPDKNSDRNNHDVVSFKTFQKETNILKAGETFSENGIQDKKNQQSNPLSGFIVDTTHINRIIANSSLSTYAFRVYSLYGSPQDLYNMVYRKRSNGTVQYSILKITDAEVSLVYDSEKGAFFQKKAHHGSTAKTPCTDYYAEFFHCKNGCSWEDCDKCSNCLTTVHIVYGDCGGTSGTGNGNTYPQNPPSNPPAEGSGGSYNLADPSGYVFDPNEMPTIDPQYVRASRAYLFWTQLDYNNQMFATEHPDIYQNLIEHYLNNFSMANNVENLNFHNQAMQYFVDHPDTTWEEFYNQFLASPCEKIKAKFADTKFKEKVTAIDKPEVFNKDEETGFAAAYGTVPYEQMLNTPNGNVRLPDGNKYFGFMHVHLNMEGVVKIFSPYDVATFLTSCVANAKLVGNIADAYAMVITSQGNYILKYSGDGNFAITYGQLESWNTWYETEYEKLIVDKQFTQPNIEKVFTQFLEEKVNIAGLEVYKTDKNTGKATKLQYNGSNNPVQPIPCPQ